MGQKKSGGGGIEGGYLEREREEVEEDRSHKKRKEKEGHSGLRVLPSFSSSSGCVLGVGQQYNNNKKEQSIRSERERINFSPPK